jgi:pimeloyl-ACP methyl ester carboxylesterase
LDKLVVVDISPRKYEPHHNAILAGLNSIDFSVENSRGKVDEKLAVFIPELGVRQFLLKNVYWKEKGQLAFRFNRKVLTNNNPEVGAALPAFTLFKKPTLFLKGENSAYITAKETPIIESHFTNVKVIEIKNAGHWLHAENPKQFYAEVSEFLS